MKKYTLTIKYYNKTYRKTVKAISELDAVIKATESFDLSAIITRINSN